MLAPKYLKATWSTFLLYIDSLQHFDCLAITNDWVFWAIFYAFLLSIRTSAVIFVNYLHFWILLYHRHANYFYRFVLHIFSTSTFHFLDNLVYDDIKQYGLKLSSYLILIEIIFFVKWFLIFIKVLLFSLFMIVIMWSSFQLFNWYIRWSDISVNSLVMSRFGNINSWSTNAGLTRRCRILRNKLEESSSFTA